MRSPRTSGSGLSAGRTRPPQGKGEIAVAAGAGVLLGAPGSRDGDAPVVLGNGADTATLRALYLAGWTLDRVGQTFGISRQAVGARLTLSPVERERALAARQALRESPPEGTPLDPERTCAVCGGPLPAGLHERVRTHGGRCAELWRMIRRRVDDDVRQNHRVANACSILRHADERDPVLVRTAWRFLAGLTRHHAPRHPGSATTRAVRRAAAMRRVA